MKNLFCWPNRETIIIASFFGVILILSSVPVTLLMILFSPSVSEAINPALNECDIYVGEVYVPCKTYEEVFWITLRFVLIFELASIVLMLFINPREKTK